ncbi:hypothetical protein [Streptomyces sp. CC224B]|uniref:hypothetical protein n=1 Tax=Streptomyces sp. CC224B TaxID=3044571 RepID=UPI0024A86E74|nr:hypothetical protein [Streptomyces sp. CC224B]
MTVTMLEGQGLPVPVRLDADRWATRRVRRRVLAVVHTVTSGRRLLDTVRLLADDWRVQVFFTAAPDVFHCGVADFLAELKGVVLPWSQAVQTVFDLAVAAGHGGLHELHAPVVVLPHGAGHNKVVPGGPRGRAVAAPGVYGLSRQRLVRDGVLVPETIVLAHHDELERLRRACPEALPAAEVVGDPCHDRVVASGPARALYRQALRTGAGERLVLVCSTWGPGSLLAGGGRELIESLVTELPPGHRVAALLHPHVWHTHSEWQVRNWFAGLGRRGLCVVDHRADWVGALVAADFVVGDHGSVSLYAAMTGAPVLLARLPDADVDPGSPLAELGTFAPRLRVGRPVLPQLTHAAAAYRPEPYARVAARITSEPGRFARNMRALLYRKLRLRAPGPVPAERPAGLPRVLTYDEPGSVVS